VAGPRDMGMEGQIRVHFGQRTQGDSCGDHGNAGKTSEEERNIYIEALRRQLECRACDKRILGVHPSHDEGISSLEEGARRVWAPAFVRVDTIRCKQIRKCTYMSVPTWRPSSETEAAAFRHGRDDGAPQSFALRPLGEHPVFLRRQCHNELASHWSREETRLLCSPVELMAAVVRKLRIFKASALLLMPDWPRQS
jgi:hypothetical protein